MPTPRERLDELRASQGDISSLTPKENPINTPPSRERLEELRVSQGDTSGEGQGDVPSNNPVFELARKSGFLKGYLDQAAGIVQIADKLKMPDIERRKRELQGIENVDAVNIDKFIENEEILYQERRAENGDTGFDWARLAGNIANPVSVATMRIPMATTGMIAKTASSGAIGLVSGLTQPVLNTKTDFKSQKAMQGTIGLGVGVIAQPVISSIKGTWDFGKYIARPFNKTGQMKDISDLYLKLAGQSKNKLIKALDNAKTRVSSNKPTSGQAIADANLSMKSAANLSADEMIDGIKSGRFANDGLPENFGGAIVKLEKELAKRGTTGDELKTVLSQQVARRSNAIKGIIDSSDDALALAIKKRTDEVSPLYDLVEKSNKLVRTGDVLKKVRLLLNKNKNEDKIAQPMRLIIGRLKDGDIIETSPQNLYSLSKQIKAMIESKSPNGGNEFNVKALSDVKKILDKQIGKAEPAFAKAQYLFKENSKPINQIMVAKELGNALENSLKKETSRPFVNAMDNAIKTLKKSTGFSRYKRLEDVMNEKQIGVLNKIKGELIRDEKAKTMATDTGTVIKGLSEGIEISLPNMLSRPMMLANAVLRQIGKDMSPAYEQLAIKIQKDPKLLSKILKSSDKSKEKQMALELLSRYSAMVPAQELSRENITTEQLSTSKRKE